MMWLSKYHRRTYPELEFFSTDDERRKALRQARKERNRSPRFWLIHVCAATLAAIVGYQLFVASGPVGRFVETFARGYLAVFAALAGFPVGFCIAWLFRRTVRDSLRRQLVERSVPICLKCGYNLHGLIEPRCPECGEGFGGGG